MAAGMGSRYGGLKQVDKITDAGEIILDFAVRRHDGWIQPGDIRYQGREPGDFPGNGG